MKLLRYLTGAALVALTMATPLSAQELIKVATFVPEKSTGVAKVIKPWMDAVQKDVGKAVTLKGFWGGTLGKSPFKQFELVKNGVADVTWVLPGYTAGQFPEMSLFELPFMFNSAQEASIVGWKLYEKGLLTGFDGVHVIGFFATEPNAIFMKNKINALTDIKGKKIRSVGPVHARWLEEFGAAPQTLSSAQYNEALNRGTIDGVIQGWTGMRTFKSFKLVDEAIEVPVGSIPFLLLMNKSKWDSLPDKVKAAITKHGGLAMAKTGAAAYSGVGKQIVDNIKSEGRISILVPDKQKMAEYDQKTKAVHQWWIKRTPNGQAVYDAAQAELAEIRGQK